MIDFGTVKPGRTIRIPFSSFDKDDGSSITMTNYTAADILIYKDGNTTERASTAGFTATTDFDSKTGKHLAIIDLADNTTSAFFNAGSEYIVAIDAVTVDGVTTGGWIARFRIGYEGALLDTTIASYTNATSFTLTNGPAEDDALNDHWAIIHDIASAVQFSRVQILDYTGSTKTVTLVAGATFTAAAGDNISIMGPMPMQPATTGRKPVVDAAGLVDANTVKVGPTGSGTAQTAGDVPGKFVGITLLAQWLGLLAGKQTGNSTARTEIRATGAGSGTYDETTHSLQALKDDAATMADIGDAVLDEVVLGSYTLRQLIRGIAASSLGKISGAATTTLTIRSADDTKDVVVGTVDANGNRSAITLDLT